VTPRLLGVSLATGAMMTEACNAAVAVERARIERLVRRKAALLREQHGSWTDHSIEDALDDMAEEIGRGG
jgi:hypothetical protein